MMRTVILASAALFPIAGTAHAREWFIYNFQSLQCENRTDELATPEKHHEVLRGAGIYHRIEVLRDPKTNEVLAAMIQAVLPNKRMPSAWVWFTSRELCEKAAIEPDPRKEDIE